MPDVFSMDVETWSAVDLTKRGSDAYSRDPGTRALMMAYHLAGSPDPGRLWLEGDPVPPEWVRHVNNGGMFSGWNVVGFDRLIYMRKFVELWGFPPIHDDAWIDSMYRASASNRPQSLDACGKSIGLQFDADLKDKNRIRKITSAARTPLPIGVTISDILNGRVAIESNKKVLAEAKEAGRVLLTRALYDDLVWLTNRCRQDIVMEEELLARLPEWPQMQPWLHMPSINRKQNDRGILLDIPLVEGLQKAATEEIKQLGRKMGKVTKGKVSSTTKVEDLKLYLIENGVSLPSNLDPVDPEDPDLSDEEIEKRTSANERKSPWKLTKNVMADILARPDIPEDCRLAVEIRYEAAKVSVAKFNRMLWQVSPDGRLRNTRSLMGAQQTGRAASRGCNLYNTVRDVFANMGEVAAMYDLDEKKDHDRLVELQQQELYDAIMVGRRGNPEEIRERYQRVRIDPQGRSQTLGVLTWISRMTRRTLSASAGHLLLNSDFAQVEARITDWLAQQLDTLNAFATGQDVYSILAASMYKCPVEQITKKDPRRQAGKIGVLLGGFGGGKRAVLAGAQQQGVLMTEDEAQQIITDYRAASPAKVAWWYATDDAMAKAVTYPGYEFPVPPLNNVSYFMHGDCLHARLPSGRLLYYREPRLTQEYWDDGKPKNRLSLSALVVKGKMSLRRSIYHTIGCENSVQAIGADMLHTALYNMDQAGLPVVLDVYDSAAAEIPEDKAHALVPLFDQCMLAQPSWCKGLPVACDTEVSSRFG